MMSELLKRTITSIVLALMLITLFLIFPVWIMSMVLIGCLGWILYDEWPQIARELGPSGWLLALVYLILPFQALVEINREHQVILALIFVLVAACDIGCYIFGSLFGKHLLAPEISPKKTWEGLIGGVLCTIGTLYFLGFTAPRDLLEIGLATALLAVAGDLFESHLKRRAGIKDTGTILPGHGGLLDRFDSVLFVALYFYYFIL